MASTSYYSVEGVLTENEKATCTFELAVPQLTALNNGSAVETGTKLELPLWIAEMLAVSRPGGPSANSLATIDLPAALQQRVLNALRADPKSIDLRAQSPFFYRVGERMLDLFDDDEVAEVLNDTFKQRALEIADKAQNPRGEGGEFLRGLDDQERQSGSPRPTRGREGSFTDLVAVFRASHEGSKAVKQWFDSNRA